MIPALKTCFRAAPLNGCVLDVGCLGFQQVANARSLGLTSLQHFGVDYAPAAPSSVPEGYVFRTADLNAEGLPFEDDVFDLVIASHVIEHVREPISLLAECIRVCRPGGRIYVEAPSERSMLLPGMPVWHDHFRSLSFYDDPTHMSRPWTPQAFYRLSRYFGCQPLETKHIVSWAHRLLLPALLLYAALRQRPDLFTWWLWSAVGWACYLVLRKPQHLRGRPNFHYSVDVGGAKAR